MYIFTAKFNRKRAVIIVLLIAVVICAIVLLAGMRDQGSETAASYSGNIDSNERRIAYLMSFGWRVDASPLDQQEIVIPREFTGAYKEYYDLQLSQGFDLSDYSGMKATRYTYEVKNYPENSGGVVADIIVCNETVIAGDIQSTALDGFMHGLSSEG